MAGAAVKPPIKALLTALLMTLATSCIANTLPSELSATERCLARQSATKSCTRLLHRFEALKPVIAKAAALYGLDARLLAALIAQESRFKPYAVSRAGATGLTQIMPSTGLEMGLKESQLTQIDSSIVGGAYYLAKMNIEFSGDWVKAIAAYNAGPGAVRKHKGVPPYRETQNYVQSVLRFYTVLVYTDQSKRPPVAWKLIYNKTA